MFTYVTPIVTRLCEPGLTGLEDYDVRQGLFKADHAVDLPAASAVS